MRLIFRCSQLSRALRLAIHPARAVAPKRRLTKPQVLMVGIIVLTLVLVLVLVLALALALAASQKWKEVVVQVVLCHKQPTHPISHSMLAGEISEGRRLSLMLLALRHSYRYTAGSAFSWRRSYLTLHQGANLSTRQRGSLMTQASAHELKGLGAGDITDIMHEQHDFGPNVVVVDVDELLQKCIEAWFEQEEENQVRGALGPGTGLLSTRSGAFRRP